MSCRVSRSGLPVYDPRGVVVATPQSMAARVERLDGSGSACSTTPRGTPTSCCEGSPRS